MDPAPGRSRDAAPALAARCASDDPRLTPLLPLAALAVGVLVVPPAVMVVVVVVCPAAPVEFDRVLGDDGTVAAGDADPALAVPAVGVTEGGPWVVTVVVGDDV